jgi:hypothetical protein
MLAQSLYAFTVTLFIIGWEANNQEGYSIHDVRNSFSYFTSTSPSLPFSIPSNPLTFNLQTDLCYWGICFYFLLSAIHTFSYALHGGTPILNRLPRALQALHYFYYTTIVTYPFLVTIVYWTILHPGNPFTTRFALWSNISQHGLNSAFGLFELLFTRINPSPWIHLLWLIVLLACYCGLAYLTQATKNFYVYSFLNPNPKNEVTGLDGKKTNIGGVGKGAVVGYVFGIAIAIVIIFCLGKGLAWARKWATEKKLGKTGRFYKGRQMGQGEAELETQRVWEK